MKVICINDKDRPNEIPKNRWVEKGLEYTISKVAFMKQQNIYGVKLEELNNDDLFPYSYISLNRFGIHPDYIKELIENKQLELEEIE